MLIYIIHIIIYVQCTKLLFMHYSILTNLHCVLFTRLSVSTGLHCRPRPFTKDLVCEFIYSCKVSHSFIWFLSSFLLPHIYPILLMVYVKRFWHYKVDREKEARSADLFDHILLYYKSQELTTSPQNNHSWIFSLCVSNAHCFYRLKGINKKLQSIEKHLYNSLRS